MGTAVRLVVACALLATSLAVAPTFAREAQAACGVSIYRIYYNSPGTDTGTNKSLNHEWIQLRNGCGNGISLDRWTIKDKAGHKYTFGSYTLAAGAKVKLHTGRGTNTSTNVYWGKRWYIWNNTGKEVATLRNGAGTLIDKCTYTGTSVGYLYC